MNNQNENNLQQNQQFHSVGHNSNTTAELSEEFLEEQEFRLLQQRQYLQLKQLEQQELELYEHQQLLQHQQQVQQRQQQPHHQQQIQQLQQQQQQQSFFNSNMMSHSSPPHHQQQRYDQHNMQQVNQQLQYNRRNPQYDGSFNPRHSLDYPRGLLNQEPYQTLVDAEALLSGPLLISSLAGSIAPTAPAPIVSSMSAPIMSSSPATAMMPPPHTISPTPPQIATIKTSTSSSYPALSHNRSVPTITFNNTENEMQLADDYEPTDLDICSGRGKAFWNHTGNVAFRNLVQSQVDTYISAPTKAEKSAIVVAIVDDLRRKGCKFLKQQKVPPNGKLVWFDIGDSQARDKVGHSLRDQVTALNRAQKEGGDRSPRSTSPKPASTPSDSCFEPVAISSTAPSFPIITDTNPALDVNSAMLTPMPDLNNNNYNNNYNHNSNLVSQQQHDQFSRSQQAQNQEQYQQYAVGHHDEFEDYPHHPRRPSISISDSGNEAEMRRSTLDTSQLLMSFGRRPSWVADSLNEMNEMHESQRSLPERQSLSQQRSALLQEEPDHIAPVRVTDDHPIGKRKNAGSWDMEVSGSYVGKQSGASRFAGGGRRAARLNAADSAELITSSIQTFDSMTHGSSGPRPSMMRMSGMSTLRMNMGSSVRMSTMRLSEFSLLSANFENMSIQDNEGSNSSLQYQDMDDSKFEI